MAPFPRLSPHSCTKAREQVSAQLDGELDQLGRVRLRAHLATCADCRRFAADLRTITAELRRAEPAPAPARLRTAWRSHLRVTVSAAATLAAATVVAFALTSEGTRNNRPILTSPASERSFDGTTYDHTTHLA